MPDVSPVSRPRAIVGRSLPSALTMPSALRKQRSVIENSLRETTMQRDRSTHGEPASARRSRERSTRPSVLQLVEQYLRRNVLEGLGLRADGDLDRITLREACTALAIGDLVAELEPVLVLEQLGTNLDPLSIDRRAHILQVAFDDGPDITRGPHLRIIVVERAQQHPARDLEVLDVVPVPADVHRIDVVERHFDRRDRTQHTSCERHLAGVRRPATAVAFTFGHWPLPHRPI